MNFKPGDKVEILIDTWMAPAGTHGVVHIKNLTEGLISVSHSFSGEKPGEGPIMDFATEYLKAVV